MHEEKQKYDVDMDQSTFISNCKEFLIEPIASKSIYFGVLSLYIKIIKLVQDIASSIKDTNYNNNKEKLNLFEEILLRLFFMSLLSWIISKIFYRKENKTPTKVFIMANVISALLFALLHIPATIQTFGYIDGLLLFRCLLMNGLFGLSFGWLYRKYGIGYSMLAHFGCHLISKLIWILYI